MLLRRPGWRRAFAVLGFLAAGLFWTEASSQKGISASDAFRIAPSAAAQDYYWTRSFGTSNNLDSGYEIRQTQDGGFVVAGIIRMLSANIVNVFTSRLWIIKLDPQGNVEWQKAFDDADNENAESVRQTEDGGYIVAGSKRLGSRYSCWVIKLTSAGGVEWQRAYGTGERTSPLLARIEITREGGFILVYTTDLLGAGGQDRVAEVLWDRGKRDFREHHPRERRGVRLCRHHLRGWFA